MFLPCLYLHPRPRCQSAAYRRASARSCSICRERLGRWVAAGSLPALLPAPQCTWALLRTKHTHTHQKYIENCLDVLWIHKNRQWTFCYRPEGFSSFPVGVTGWGTHRTHFTFTGRQEHPGVFCAQLREQQHQSSGRRDTRLIMTLGEMRVHSVGRHMEKWRWWVIGFISSEWQSRDTDLHFGFHIQRGLSQLWTRTEALSRQEVSVYSHLMSSTPLHPLFSLSVPAVFLPSLSLPHFFSPSVSTASLFPVISSSFSQRSGLAERWVMLCLKGVFTWLAQPEKAHLTPLSPWAQTQRGCHVPNLYYIIWCDWICFSANRRTFKMYKKKWEWNH